MGVPALKSADICFVKIDKLFVEIFNVDFFCELDFILSGVRPLSCSICLASSRSVAFINPEVFFSLESNALYLNVAINLP